MSTYFVDILETTIPVSVLIGLLLMLSPVIKRGFVAKWRYFMWLFASVRLIVPLHIPVFTAPVTMELPRQISGMPVMAETAGSASGGSPVSLQTILMLIWIIGAAVFGLYQLICYVSFRRTVKRWSKRVTDENTLKIFNEIKSDLNERRALDFRICKTITTPMVSGLIKPALLLPDCKYTDRELDVILRHEMVHFKRNDIWYKLILITANAVNWFNPLVYVMVNTANKDIELACDAEVVKERDMEYRRGYCEAILAVVHNKKAAAVPLSTCFIISRRVIRERFNYILDLKKKRKGILLFVIAALSITASGGAVTFATEKTADILEEELKIVERPAPRPRAAKSPVQTQTPYEAQISNNSYYAEPKTEYNAYYEEAPAEYDTVYTEPKADYENEQPETVAPRRDISEQNIVDVTKGSVSFNASFRDKGQSMESVHTFTSDTEATMTVYSTNGSISVTDADTDEVVYDGSVSEERTARVPVKPGQRLNVSVTSTDEGESHASVYAYGYAEEVIGDAE